MTSAVLALIEQPSIMDSAATTIPGPPPRKRRRRTAAGGASDDCFACRGRGAKCDRKRPYCTQCIEIGKECSGYKTTLTWGVGVASRGKLRGLSCPIANKNADGSDVTAVEMEARRRKSSVSKVKKENGTSKANVTSTSDHQAVGQVSMSMEPPSLSSTFLPPGVTTNQSHSPTEWRVGGFQDHGQARQAENPRQLSLARPPLDHLQTSLRPRYDGLTEPSSALSVSSYAETEFHSPMEYVRNSAPVPYSEPLTQTSSVPFQDQAMTASSTDSFSMNMPASEPYSQSHSAHIQDGNLSASQPELGNSDGIMFNGDDPMHGYLTSGDLTLSPFDSGYGAEEDELENQRSDLSLVDTRFSSPFFQISPRLQTLMDYYDRHVCPYLVAFDGAENPYRKHVLALAMNNNGLQNAIAALAVNNHRMRKKQQRRIGFVEETLDQSDFNEPSPEETSYKQLSIDQLNMQLIHPAAAQDDSVLATLLILCLFHVCHSGFSKFKTQLAGVQKLMSLRDPTTQSDFTRWIEMFFTWFDVMTSTVNDREMQIKGSSLSMLDYSANLGAMEQYAGCDGRLFKLIAKLGRLNLLAQGRPVRRKNGAQRTSLPLPMRPPSFLDTMRKRQSVKRRANKSLSAADYENIDGNGWGTPILSSDEDADGSADEDITPSDQRHDFWDEWHDVRDRLLSWQMDTLSIPSTNLSNGATSSSELDTEQRDLFHINESFRFAALLYTERLGNLLLPSAHQQLQSLVSQGLYHITALPITSCANKFLLWPLFIIGTECVDESHRNIIRNRCRDLTEESGFFNNISSLDVLERVWSGSGVDLRGGEADEVKARRRDSEVSRSGRYGQAFQWRKAMDRAEGEYIVI